MATSEYAQVPARGGTDAARLRAFAGSVWALVAGSVAVAALSLLAPSAPTYDPWAWIIWGREVTQLDLDTVFGPSWKPLPVLFTAPFALAGDAAAPLLWVVVARAGALLGLLLAFRVAYRLAGRGFPGAVAGAGAFLALGLSTGWVRNGLLANSEGLLVACVLWAVDRHLDGARLQAFALGVAAGLLRPEVWPFFGLYALWLFAGERRARPLLAGGLVLQPVLWFGPEWWGSGDPLRASTRARAPDLGTVAYAERPALEVTTTAIALIPLAALAGAAIAVAIAAAAYARRRERGLELAFAGGAAGWIALVALMTEAGYAGNPRYALLAGSLVCVLGGVGAAHLVRASGRAAARRGTRLAAAVPVAVALGLGAGSLAFAGPHLDAIERTIAENREQALLAEELPEAIEAAGGREALLACGSQYTGKYRVPLVAWHLGVHIQDVTIVPELPAILYYAHGAPPLGTGRLPFTTLAREGKWTIMAACSRPGSKVVPW